nr:2Fe-2S iron-sulfur cluster binding domain-containing protein [Pandoraea pnomenusa]
MALAAHGIELPASCEQGVCGTCLTRVLGGEPDHRDMYLTPEEQAQNDQFLPCCSRSKSLVWCSISEFRSNRVARGHCQAIAFDPECPGGSKTEPRSDIARLRSVHPQKQGLQQRRGWGRKGPHEPT